MLQEANKAKTDKLKNTIIFMFISYIVTILTFYYFYSSKPENKDKYLTIYTYEDIIYVNVNNNTVSTESSDDVKQFGDWNALTTYVEDITVKNILPSRYGQEIKYHINNGNIKLEIHPDLGKNGKVLSPVGFVNLVYDGPIWEDDTRDTSYLLGQFFDVKRYSITYDEYGDKEFEMIQLEGSY